MDESDELYFITFEVIDWMLCHTDIDIQSLDCRALSPDDSLMLVTCSRSVDFSISQSIALLNQIRKQKHNQLFPFLCNETRLDKLCCALIADYCFGGEFIFEYDEKNYNERTGMYLEAVESGDEPNILN